VHGSERYRSTLSALTAARQQEIDALSRKLARQDRAIAAHCEARITLDAPVNIHLTGCHHSCAQHYIGDLGLIGAKVPLNEDGDTVPGYDVLVGGGYGVDGGMARPFREKVKAEEAPALVEAILRTWTTHRATPDESFVAFARRHEIADLKALVAQTGEAA